MDLQIIDELKDVLEKNSTVHAMWIAGSVAEGYSDGLVGRRFMARYR